MRFEIRNPSDYYSMTTDDFEIAAVAVCILGEGKYALTEEGTEPLREVPLFLFGGQDAWFGKQFGRTFEESIGDVIRTRKAALADCLASVALKEGARRSSLNDIGGEAHRIAKSLRGNKQ